MTDLLICAHCGAENADGAPGCGFCGIDFRDLPPKRWPGTTDTDQH